jgi:hypothetical protein
MDWLSVESLLASTSNTFVGPLSFITGKRDRNGVGASAIGWACVFPANTGALVCMYLFLEKDFNGKQSDDLE